MAPDLRLTTPMPTTTLDPHAVPFGELLEFLRRQGFPIGLDHYVRLQSLLEAIGGDCPPDRLKTLLCPIFATSRDQQEHFHRAFDQFYPLFTPPPAHVIRTGGAVEDLMPPQPERSRWRVAINVAGGLLAAALVIGVVWRIRTQAPAPQAASPADSAAVAPSQAEGLPPAAGDSLTPAPPATAETPTLAPPPEPPPAARVSFLRRNAGPLRALAVALPILLFLLNEWRLYRRRRLVIQRQRREKPPFVWPIRVAQPANPYIDSAELHYAARLMREREQGESVRLAVDETVTATIEAMGLPTLRFRSDTRPPDYLVLIERAAFRDHGARLFNDLGRALEREGVHVTRFYYDGDPRICHPESGGDQMLLVDLRRRYPTYRLLVFGNGAALIDPISGRLRPWTSEFLSWNERALLTPEAPRGWGQREVTLAGHFIVLPATVQGLLALVEHFRTPLRPSLRAWRDRSTEPLPPSAAAAEIRELRRYLGDQGFRWLAACAVYPELHWDLTLHLGQLPIMPPDLITEQNLLRLLRLSWFRAGALPDDLRSALMAELDPETERAVRTAIVGLLESDPAPGDSVASNRYELELVVQRLALSRDNAPERRKLLQQVAGLPRTQVMQDMAVLQLLERAPSSRLAMLLPSRLREVFFSGGIPLLGMRAGARAGVAMLLTLAAFLFTRPAAPVDERAPVEQVLLRYAEAAADGDLQSMLVEYPGMSVLDRARWQDAFKQKVRIDTSKWRITDVTFSGSTATATVGGTTVMRDIRSKVVMEELPTSFSASLEKVGSRWRILSFSTAPSTPPTAPATTPFRRPRPETSPSSRSSPTRSPSGAVIASVRVFPNPVKVIAEGDGSVQLIARAYDAAEAYVPAATFTYATSGDPGIQVLPNGTLTFSGDSGDATVVVTSGAATAQVTVMVRTITRTNAMVELRPDRLALKVGERAQIVPITSLVDPFGKRYELQIPILWRSADPRIATVAPDGTVEAVGAGRTSISAGDSVGVLASAEVEVR